MKLTNTFSLLHTHIDINMEKMRKKSRKWTNEETEALRAGVEKHGFGKWTAILSDSQFASSFDNRSNIDLKVFFLIKCYCFLFYFFEFLTFKPKYILQTYILHLMLPLYICR